MAASTEDVQAALTTMDDEFLEARSAESHYEWRYCVVRYPTMREGNSGIYDGADGRLGYELTMLRKTVQRSWYRDAYLYAIRCEAGRPSEVEDPWSYGYSTEPRWMELIRSGTGLRSVPTGIAVRAPVTPTAVAALQAVCASTGAAIVDEGRHLSIPQTERDGDLIDTVDRVQVAADLLEELIAAGLRCGTTRHSRRLRTSRQQSS